jgi:hypothetical protein
MKKLFKFFGIISLFLFGQCNSNNEGPLPINPADMQYGINVNAGDFKSNEITGNTYFPFAAGTTYTYEGEDEDGTAITVTEEHLNETKTILGVTCVIIHAREYEDGELVENTYDWYAQDLAGNMWYFGEDSKEIEDGKVVSTAGSWEAGVDGALPGVIMLANPIPGMWYRQEYYKGEAEDVAQILSVSETLTVPYGTFTNCLQTAEWTPLEKNVLEHKYYAPGIGMLRAIAVKGDASFEDLVSIQ